MALTIQVNLSSDIEAALRDSIARGDKERVRSMLADAVMPTLEALLLQHPRHITDDTEWDVLAEQLFDMFGAAVSTDIQPLSDYAISREGIYEEHP